MKKYMLLFLIISLITYHSSPAFPATPITKFSTKGGKLTFTEVDGNFENLRTAIDNGLGAQAAQISALIQGQAGGTFGFTTKALMDADLAHGPGVLAKVTNDPTPTNNGGYIKLGASGAGSWQRAAYQDQPFVLASSYADFASAVAAQGSNRVTLVITDVMSVTTAVSVPPTLTLMFAGGYLSLSGNGAVGGLKLYDLEMFGGKADGSTDNTAALAALAKSVNISGHCKIIFHAGTYNYSPQNTYSSAYAWRSDVEMVDVVDVTIEGYGAVLQSVVPSGWAIGDGGNYGNEEGAVQFRSSALATDGYPKCRGITIRGLTSIGTRLTGGHVSDGNAFGIALRGIYLGLIEDVKCSNWSTDGAYLGMGYTNVPAGLDITVKNSTFDLNMRQGVSVVGTSRVKFLGCTFSNTSGSSFGYGLDLEPDGSLAQSDITVTASMFRDNQRGAFNIIRSSNVIVNGNIISEQYSGSSPGAGAIYVDGGQGTTMGNVVINNNTITANKSILYVLGTDIDGFEFSGNICTMTDIIAGSAHIVRLSPSTGNTNTNFRIRNNRFKGCGSLLLAVAGDIWFEDNVVQITRSPAYTNVFAYGITSADGSVIAANAYVRRNKIALDSTLAHTGTVDCYIPHGDFSDNEVSSNSSALVSIQNYGGGRDLIIGFNKFSTYFYYKGEHTELDAKVPSTIIQYTGALYDGSQVRVVPGGWSRTAYGSWAQVGDVTYEWAATSGNPAAYKCTVAGSPGTWVVLWNKQ